MINIGKGMSGAGESISGAGKVGAIVETVKTAETTETGQFALKIVKGGVITIIAIVAIGAFITIRTMNQMFGETKKQIASSSNMNLRTRLYDYFKGKYPMQSDSEINAHINEFLK